MCSSAKVFFVSHSVLPGNRLGVHKRFEGDTTGHMTQTNWRDIPGHALSRSAIKRGKLDIFRVGNGWAWVWYLKGDKRVIAFVWLILLSLFLLPLLFYLLNYFCLELWVLPFLFSLFFLLVVGGGGNEWAALWCLNAYQNLLTTTWNSQNNYSHIQSSIRLSVASGYAFLMLKTGRKIRKSYNTHWQTISKHTIYVLEATLKKSSHCLLSKLIFVYWHLPLTTALNML